MEHDLNHFRASGTIVEDATLKELLNGKWVANFYLKIQEAATAGDGSKIKLTNMVRVVGWNELAKHAATHGKRGARVVIDARLHVSKWEGRNGAINVAYEVHLTSPLKPLQESSEPLPPLTPNLYPEPET